MKKIFSLLIACACLSLFATSCSSTYDASPDTDKSKIRNPLQGDFTALIDGVQFTANTKSFTDNVFEDIRTISITAVQDSPEKDPETNKTITIIIPNYTGPKAYPIESSIYGSYIDRYEGSATIYTAKANDTLAVINITNDGDKWEGSFNMVVAPENGGEEIVISNGAFSIPK